VGLVYEPRKLTGVTTASLGVAGVLQRVSTLEQTRAKKPYQTPKASGRASALELQRGLYSAESSSAVLLHHRCT
jgi:hypothetical protein